MACVFRVRGLTDRRASAVGSPPASSCPPAYGATARAAARSSDRVPTASSCSPAPPTPSKVLRRRLVRLVASRLPPSPAPLRQGEQVRPPAVQLWKKQRHGFRKKMKVWKHYDILLIRSNWRRRTKCFAWSLFLVLVSRTRLLRLRRHHFRFSKTLQLIPTSSFALETIFYIMYKYVYICVCVCIYIYLSQYINL